MKKLLIVLSFFALVGATSCKDKSENKQSETSATSNEVTYQATSDGSEVFWTGYKFTNKTPVKGKFKYINVLNAPVAKNQIDAFNGLEFSIPASSVFSENAIRDGKLASLFFGVMDHTEFLTGTFSTKGENIFLNLKMNGTIKELPITHKVSDRHVRIEGSLNVLDFGADLAYNSIHKACEQLHTGTDGISKTWEDVAIEAIVYLK